MGGRAARRTSYGSADGVSRGVRLFSWSEAFTSGGGQLMFRPVIRDAGGLVL